MRPSWTAWGFPGICNVGQFIISHLGVCSLGVENELGVVEGENHLFRGNALGFFNPHAHDLGESGEGTSTGSWKLIVADESTFVFIFKS